MLCLCHSSGSRSITSFFFFFNDTATTEIYTLSLHDALPISYCGIYGLKPTRGLVPRRGMSRVSQTLDTVGLFARSIEDVRSEEHTSELQSQSNLVCRLLLEKKKKRRKHKT